MQDGVFPEDQTKEWKAYTDQEVKDQITRLDNLVYDIVGFTPNYYSAPYGQVHDYDDVSGKSLPYWSNLVITHDWKPETTKKEITETILTAPNHGIVLMHDVYQKTADAIREALASPQAKEIQFVTFDEMDEILELINGNTSR